MKVRFSSVEEFLEELRIEQEKQHVTDGVIRITCSYQPDRHHPQLSAVTVIAGVVMRGQLVELHKLCGIVADFPEDQASQKTRERAQAAMAQLRTAAQELALLVRKGVFEL